MKLDHAATDRAHPDPSPARPELRVLQVYSTLGVGGAEMWLIALLRYFREHDDELPWRVKVDVCLTSGERGELDDEARDLGADLHYLRYSLRNLATFARQFRALLKRRRYAAIHDHQEHTAGLHFLMAAGALPPVRAVHFHNPTVMRSRDYQSVKGRLVTAAGYALARRFATHMLGTSLHTLAEQKVDSANVPERVYAAVLHCGFDTERFAGNHTAVREALRDEMGWDASTRILLFVGRLHTDPLLNQKNPGFALDTAAESMNANADVRMIFAGAGEAGETELRDRAAALGLAERFRFLGVRSDIPRLMLGSDLLLFPTFAEGLGMVAVEAQAAGLRVLASDVVPRECVVLADLVSFLPLSLGSAAWARAVDALLDTPCPDAAACNRAVRNSAFSIEQSARRLLEVYAGADRSS